MSNYSTGLIFKLKSFKALLRKLRWPLIVFLSISVIIAGFQNCSSGFTTLNSMAPQFVEPQSLSIAPEGPPPMDVSAQLQPMDNYLNVQIDLGLDTAIRDSRWESSRYSTDQIHLFKAAPSTGLYEISYYSAISSNEMALASPAGFGIYNLDTKKFTLMDPSLKESEVRGFYTFKKVGKVLVQSERYTNRQINVSLIEYDYTKKTKKEIFNEDIYQLDTLFVDLENSRILLSKYFPKATINYKFFIYNAALGLSTTIESKENDGQFLSHQFVERGVHLIPGENSIVWQAGVDKYFLANENTTIPVDKSYVYKWLGGPTAFPLSDLSAKIKTLSEEKLADFCGGKSFATFGLPPWDSIPYFYGWLEGDQLGLNSKEGLGCWNNGLLVLFNTKDPKAWTGQLKLYSSNHPNGDLIYDFSNIKKEIYDFYLFGDYLLFKTIMRSPYSSQLFVLNLNTREMSPIDLPHFQEGGFSSYLKTVNIGNGNIGISWEYSALGDRTSFILTEAMNSQPKKLRGEFIDYKEINAHNIAHTFSAIVDNDPQTIQHRFLIDSAVELTRNAARWSLETNFDFNQFAISFQKMLEFNPDPNRNFEQINLDSKTSKTFFNNDQQSDGRFYQNQTGYFVQSGNFKLYRISKANLDVPELVLSLPSYPVCTTVNGRFLYYSENQSLKMFDKDTLTSTVLGNLPAGFDSAGAGCNLNGISLQGYIDHNFNKPLRLFFSSTKKEYPNEYATALRSITYRDDSEFLVFSSESDNDESTLYRWSFLEKKLTQLDRYIPQTAFDTNTIYSLYNLSTEGDLIRLYKDSANGEFFISKLNRNQTLRIQTEKGSILIETVEFLVPHWNEISHLSSPVSHIRWYEDPRDGTVSLKILSLESFQIKSFPGLPAEAEISSPVILGKRAFFIGNIARRRHNDLYFVDLN